MEEPTDCSNHEEGLPTETSDNDERNASSFGSCAWNLVRRSTRWVGVQVLGSIVTTVVLIALAAIVLLSTKGYEWTKEYLVGEIGFLSVAAIVGLVFIFLTIIQFRVARGASSVSWLWLLYFLIAVIIGVFAIIGGYPIAENLVLPSTSTPTPTPTNTPTPTVTPTPTPTNTPTPTPTATPTPNYLPAVEFLQSYLDWNNAATDEIQAGFNWDYLDFDLQGALYNWDQDEYSSAVLATRIRYVLYACSAYTIHSRETYYPRWDTEFNTPLKNNGNDAVRYIAYRLQPTNESYTEWKIMDMAFDYIPDCPEIYNSAIPSD